MYIKILVSLLACAVSAAQAGHYVFWAAMASKSIKVGMMDIGYELANRGHEVTILSPFIPNKNVKGVTEIVIESDFVKITDSITQELLSHEGAQVPVGEFIKLSIDNNRNAMTHPKFIEIMETKPFDVLITTPFFGNEGSYYVAHKKNASLVLFMSAPFGFSWMNWANGDPYNPAYMPMFTTSFSQSMSFLERLTNTAVAAFFHVAVRGFNALPKVHSLLAEVFPLSLIHI